MTGNEVAKMIPIIEVLRSQGMIENLFDHNVRIVISNSFFFSVCLLQEMNQYFVTVLNEPFESSYSII